MLDKSKTLQETENPNWPLGQKFLNVGKTKAAAQYPDVVTIANCFKTAHDDILIMKYQQHTFLIPARMAELIYQRQGINKPILF